MIEPIFKLVRSSGNTPLQGPLDICAYQVFPDEDEMAQARLLFCPESILIDCKTVVDPVEDGSTRSSLDPENTFGPVNF